jgi:hypothetical protein
MGIRLDLGGWLCGNDLITARLHWLDAGLHQEFWAWMAFGTYLGQDKSATNIHHTAGIFQE